MGEVSDDTVPNAEPSKRDETLTNRRGRWHEYIEDAESEGDQELADFFREVQQQDAERAQRARTLLTTRQ